MKNENKFFGISIYIIVGIFLFISIVYPILSVFINVGWSGLNELINEELFKQSLFNSTIVSFITTVISVLIAYLLAFAVNRTKIKYKKVLSIIFVLPMLIPSISHGLGLINLFGNNGLFTKWLGIDFNILGINGIIIGSILYSFPIAFLILTDAFKYIDNSMYENALVLGLNRWQTFRKITFYYMKKPLLSAVFAVFTLVFTDYGVPLAVGGRYSTLAVFLYREVIGLLDFSKGALIGIFLLIPAFVSFIFDLFSKEVVVNTFYNKKYTIRDNKIRDILFSIFSWIIVIFLVVLFGSFIYLSFVNNFPYDNTFSLIHFEYVFENGILKYIINSIFISAFCAIIGTIFAYFTAYTTSRLKFKISILFHALSMFSLAIPGIFLGLSYIFAFKDSFIYQTFLILIMVNVVHFFASPYLMAYNALGKLNNNFEIVGLTFGINRFRIIKDVIIPNSIDTLLEMISYFFVNSMITISAVSFLFNTKIMPVSLLINQYEGQLMYEEAAIVSLFILIINLLFKGLIGILKNKVNRRKIYAVEERIF